MVGNSDSDICHWAAKNGKMKSKETTLLKAINCELRYSIFFH